jgi:hypothetical protein
MRSWSLDLKFMMVLMDKGGVGAKPFEKSPKAPLQIQV